MYPTTVAVISLSMQPRAADTARRPISLTAAGFAVSRTFRRIFSVSLAACLFLCLPASVAPADAFGRQGCSDQRAERFVVERLNVWQGRLNLNHWKISVMTSHQRDLRPNTLGNVQWYPNDKFALIQVLDASEYKLGCREMLDDMEFTVVHELVHLELAPLPRSEASRREEEVAVNHIAHALLALDRRR
jgi:hypothetical protein